MFTKVSLAAVQKRDDQKANKTPTCCPTNRSVTTNYGTFGSGSSAAKGEGCREHWPPNVDLKLCQIFHLAAETVLGPSFGKCDQCFPTFQVTKSIVKEDVSILHQRKWWQYMGRRWTHLGALRAKGNRESEHQHVYNSSYWKPAGKREPNCKLRFLIHYSALWNLHFMVPVRARSDGAIPSGPLLLDRELRRRGLRCR